MSEVPDQEAASALAPGIESLSQQVEVLRESIDELRDEVVYELRRLRDALLDVPRFPAPVRSPSDSDSATEAAQSPASIDELDFRAFLKHLQAACPALRLRAEDWVEDFEFPLGDIVEIDGEIWDWFAECLVTVADGQDWFVAEDGDESYYVLWLRDARCFLRMLVDAEAERFGFLKAVDQRAAGDALTASTVPLPPPIVQPTLW